jgi:hypothetical protein
MELYLELNEEERAILRSKLLIIHKGYKRFCILIDTDINGQNDTEITNIINTVNEIIQSDIQKIIYNGLGFLALCMSKVENTDIQYPIEYLNYLFNAQIYNKYIDDLIDKRDKHKKIDKNNHKYYYLFIMAELIKYRWLRINSENLCIDSIIHFTSSQIKYKIRINKYIDEQINICKDTINYLYDNLKINFPEWNMEIGRCKDINFTFGNPMELYFNGVDYVKN